MKIFSAKQIREIDKKTIEYEQISSLQLMKQAAQAFYRWIVHRFPDKNKTILIVCGTGNNGGDGLVIGRLLAKSGYNVQLWVVEYSEMYSEDCAHNIRRAKVENIAVKFIHQKKDISDITAYDIVIDALFGTGLSREIEGIAKEVISEINATANHIVSVDIPSGLFMDKQTTFAVKANQTVTFQLPKLSLYLPENYQFTGDVFIENIGLNKKAIAEAETDAFFMDKEEIKPRLKPLSKIAHKGTQGHALLVGGSLGKIGSVYLSTKAALKAGCGLVTSFVPKCGTIPLQSHFPEAMIIEDENDSHITAINANFRPNAIGIGIGMSTHPETQAAFHAFLKENTTPLVIDADGLNILSQNPDWVNLLPEKTVLTPHPKELSRLIGLWCDDYDKINKAKAFAADHDLIFVIKGAHTIIVDSDKFYVNSSGTSALATAGSGDVLTGIIAGLLAQGYSPLDAACIGVYLHGLTADITEQKIHPRSFIASDIIENISNAYFELEKT